MGNIAYIFYGSLFLTLVLIATANRTMAELSLLPKEFSYFGLDFSFSLPVYLIFFSGTLLGIFMGVFWEWLRQQKHRAELLRQTRKLRRLESELKTLKDQRYKGQDEILMLLDETA